ncbi:ATP-dependent Clp protease ATP-binding subunit ClpX [Rhizoctonia solani 123E]|uniref:ATP-dependent Clp protease ATP-binding subunit ClpX n=1 Tax=Rhizoctonia solani 123E TaxID=1423351 RepID=A0A074RX43_9AGAM|nr:ATP-dependent Clp protease ATP-binding subunit ClpX [Rhizoctonia solani 123E]
MLRRVTSVGSSGLRRGYVRRAAVDRDPSRSWHNPATAWPGASASGISPRALVAHLDSFVVGQERAKKVLAVAVYNHYSRIRAILHASIAAGGDDLPRWPPLNVSDVPPVQPHPHRTPYDHSERQFPHQHSRLGSADPSTPFEKSNVLLIGPTGSGKTLLARTLAKVLDVPFAMSDATAFTQAGYVGEDAEMCIHRLLQASNWDPMRASTGIVCIDEADKIARKSGAGHGTGGRDVGGEGVQQALLRMIEGATVTVHAKGVSDPAAPPGTSGPTTGMPMGPDIVPGRGVPGANAGPKSETYQVDTSNVLFILSGAFVGLDKVILNRMSKGSIGFGAPLASDTESKTGFMPFFTPNEKKGEVAVLDMIEPTDLINFGYIPEFISRLPCVTALRPLTVPDMLRVLTEVRGALVKQYESLFAGSGVEIRFTSGALREICERAIARGMGARGLRAIMESALLDCMYDVPGSGVRYVLIDVATVRGDRPAGYWSRGQATQFYSALAAEEALNEGTLTTGEPDPESDQLAAELAERERERNAKGRRKASGGSQIP